MKSLTSFMFYIDIKPYSNNKEIYDNILIIKPLFLIRSSTSNRKRYNISWYASRSAANLA